MRKLKSHAKTHRSGIIDSLMSSISTLIWPIATPFYSAPAQSWVETTFFKRECSRFIPHPKDEQKCGCGRFLKQHKHLVETVSSLAGELWFPSRCTIPLPTDAYGVLEFQGGPHPSKAQYIRVAHDTKPEHLMQLITKEWNLELPKLLISVQGGKANFELQPKLKKVLRRGLLKAARSTGAWIFTAGTNTVMNIFTGSTDYEKGWSNEEMANIHEYFATYHRSLNYVLLYLFCKLNPREELYYFLTLQSSLITNKINSVTKHVGDALLLERSQRTGRVNTLGIAPWGIVENNHELIGHNTEVPYHSISSPRSKFAALNNRHAYFLLVDNGTVGKYGAEIVLRRRLEKYISKQRLYPFTQSPIPLVCLVIEGGTNTIRAILEYVTDDPPVPVVVCDGTGRAADLIAFMCKYEIKVLISMKEYIIATIQKAFEVAIELAEGLYKELMLCVENKNLITIYRIADKYDQKPQELDQTILTALFKSQHLSPTEQLSLALTWNRADIARSEIFIYGQEWPKGALEDAMMKALEHDRCDFVKLLLENGVSMRKFLTIPRLENLYNSKEGPSNTLRYILRDLRPHLPPGYVYTLHDIGLVINKLMGGAYRAFYTRRKFRPIYAKVMNKEQNPQRNSKTYAKQYGNAMSLLAQALPSNASPCLFDYPFNELLMWAVLMKRHKMALLMWQHGEEALAKALVACKLYKAMAHEAAEDDMETEVYEELRIYGREFETIALEVLDYCYRQDDDQTQQLLTSELQNWSGQTCLSLAVAANHRALLAHPCSQIILADLWMGGLRTRKNTNLKVILGLLFPPYILTLEFKSKEELQLMPQTTEEHMELENDDDDDKSESEKNVDGEKRPRSLSVRSAGRPQGVKALLAENFFDPESIMQENGKIPFDFDENKYHIFYTDTYPEKLPKSKELKISKKLYEFYTAPITKFWANSVAYLLFLIVLSYTILINMEEIPSWQEWMSIAFLCTFGCEKLRELFSSEPVGLKQKIAVWSWNLWNPCDMAAVLLFLIGVSLRFRTESQEVGRVIYCVNSIYWYLHILNILSVNKYLGPLVTMMGKMVKNMIYFVVLLLIVLMSYGVARQAILFPNQEPTWSIARDVFLEPYFMLYGEVYADKIDPPCGGEGEEVCQPGRWVSPAIMSIYLLVANILLINLLIAVFNNIFNEVNAIAHQVWMFQRFTVVMEYEQKPLLPPPFIVFSHIYLLYKYLRRKMAGKEESYDNGLKLFLDRDEMERLYDFEEDCVEGYFAEQEFKLQQSTEERIKVTTERIEHLTQKVEDIHLKENMQTTVLQNLEIRCRKLGEQLQEVFAEIEMMGKTGEGKKAGHLEKQTSDTVKASEDGNMFLPAKFAFLTSKRRPIVRSLTEVRPDAYIFDNGQHIEYRLTETDEINEQLDFNKKRAAKVSTSERQRSRSTDSKASVDSMELSTDDLAALSLDALRIRAALKRKEDSTGRRKSLGGNGDDPEPISKRNLNLRQLSQTQSEPETSEPPLIGTAPVRSITLERNVTFTEPRIKVHPPGSSAEGSTRGALLMHMHTEYTSITDELESVCGLLSPPRSPGLLSPPRPEQSPPSIRRRCYSEMSNPEIAINFEKEHLRSAEESDYMVLENLIQRRYEEEEENIFRDENAELLSVVTEKHELRISTLPARTLQRGGTVENDFLAASASNSDMAGHPDTSDSNDPESPLAIPTQMSQRPAMIVDHTQLPIQREIQKADSNSSLHMQSETMC